jgi:uncharacterized protein
MSNRLAIATMTVLALLAGVEVAVGFLQTRSNFVPDVSSHGAPLSVRCGDGVTVHPVSIATGIGSAVRGWYAPPARDATIVLLHGTGASSASLAADFCMYAEAGFGAVAYDSPGYGGSVGRIGWGEHERDAFLATVRWIRDQPGQSHTQIGAVGYSAGGFILACAAAQESRVGAVVLAGTPGRIRDQFFREVGGTGSLKAAGALLALAIMHDESGGDLQAIDCVSRINPRPLLVIRGERDPIIDPAVTERLYERAGNPKMLWTVPGAGHMDFLSVAGSVYRNRMVHFFESALMPAVPKPASPTVAGR